MADKKKWYIVDGYRPSPTPDPHANYRGHESIMILNTNDVDAHVRISVYFEDKDPVENIPYVVPAKRVRCFTTDDKEALCGLELGIGEQYSMEFDCDVDIIVQYGRLDVQQPNMAYMALIAHNI
ncbi:MAG: sensory rhodopsin transducer [Clostridia bacterium]|nr:sensory rhodopsin transducer [Clostridia bacterium]